MKIIRNKIFILLFIISCNNLFAADSPYSKFGIGNIFIPQNVISSGRAATGISLSSIYYSNRLNPAGLNLIGKTVFSADAYYNGMHIQDTKANNFLSSFKFFGFDLTIPLSTSKGITTNLGLIPYSSVDYTIKKNVVIENFSNELEYKGDGGLSNAYLSASFNLINELSLGLKLNYIFGNIYHQITQNAGASKTEIYRVTKLYNLNGTFGLIYSGLGKLIGLKEAHQINFGFIYSNQFNLNAEVNRYFDFYFNQRLVTQDTLLMEKSKLQIPAALGFGISYVYNKRYLLASDIYFQNWSSTQPIVDMDGKFKNNLRYSFGLEIIPYTGKVSQLQRFGYRAGMFYNQSYLRVNSVDIDELGFTIGTDFPIFGDTRLALGFEYSIRGDKKVQRDKIYKLTIGLIGTELWFVRPEEE